MRLYNIYVQNVLKVKLSQIQREVRFRKNLRKGSKFIEFFVISEFAIRWWFRRGRIKSCWFWVCLFETQRWELPDANCLFYLAIRRTRGYWPGIASNLMQCQWLQRKLWYLEYRCHFGMLSFPSYLVTQFFWLLKSWKHVEYKIKV